MFNEADDFYLPIFNDSNELFIFIGNGRKKRNMHNIMSFVIVLNMLSTQVGTQKKMLSQPFMPSTLYRVYLLTFKSSSQSCGGLQDKQFDIGHLWSNEMGTNLKLVQKMREEIGVSMHERAGLARRDADFRVRRK